MSQPAMNDAPDWHVMAYVCDPADPNEQLDYIAVSPGPTMRVWLDGIFLDGGFRTSARVFLSVTCLPTGHEKKMRVVMDNGMYKVWNKGELITLEKAFKIMMEELTH